LFWQATALNQFPDCGLAIGRFGIIGRPPGDLAPLWGNTAQFAGVVDDPDTRPEFFRLDGPTAFRGLLRRNFPGSNSSLCVRREVLRTIGGFDERRRICTDLDLELRTSLRGPFAVVNRVIYQYRWRPTSFSRTSGERTMLELLAVRTKWAARRRDWAGEEYWSLYWSVREAARQAVLNKRCRLAAKLALMLLLHRGNATLLWKKLSRLIPARPR
jgi:GT2 family glycosyltransferase